MTPDCTFITRSHYSLMITKTEFSLLNGIYRRVWRISLQWLSSYSQKRHTAPGEVSTEQNCPICETFHTTVLADGCLLMVSRTFYQFLSKRVLKIAFQVLQCFRIPIRP
ncbi:hypothetical protein AVEN_202733-1 [Araneus ventricosus]|uniref:Uncharacterized protein n=1 Tax=Araneus ventricosus TaxID=182803 RepID=A0A4Y2DJR0_ARAVE|nr:hypothetical protein AVEN_202733-1 [Araneus ventricosus]